MSDELHSKLPVTTDQIDVSNDESLFTPTGDLQPKLESAFFSAEFYSGAYPPPSFVEHYEHIVPGAAREMLDEQKAEASHRRKLEAAAVRAQLRDRLAERGERKRGQDYALIASLVLGSLCIIGGVIIALVVKEWHGSLAAAVFELAGIATIAKLFLDGKSSKEVPKSEGEKTASSDTKRKAPGDEKELSSSPSTTDPSMQ